MKQKIIFLDIDGVLNGYDFWRLLGWNIACKLHIQEWYRKHTRNPFGIHEEKVKRLAKIINKTDAKVVLSSSWRHAFRRTPYEDKKDDLKLFADLLEKYNIEIIDITPKSCDGRRDKEILTWLAHNEYYVESYVILDDEKFDLECFVGSHLVQTKDKNKYYTSLGLKNKHVKQAISILNNPIKIN